MKTCKNCKNDVFRLNGDGKCSGCVFEESLNGQYNQGPPPEEIEKIVETITSATECGIDWSLEEAKNISHNGVVEISKLEKLLAAKKQAYKGAMVLIKSTIKNMDLDDIQGLFDKMNQAMKND